jgi:hypothetical protein
MYRRHPTDPPTQELPSAVADGDKDDVVVILFVSTAGSRAGESLLAVYARVVEE